MRPARDHAAPRLALTLAATCAIVALGAGAALAARALTRSNAGAVANAISLRHADLPTLTQVANPVTAQDLRLENQAITCAGAVPLSKAWANTQSPIFQTGSSALVAISSSTEVLPSRSLVAQDVAAFVRTRALPCLLREVESGLASGLPKSAKLTNAHVTRLALPVSGAAGSFAVRVTVTVRTTQSGTTTSIPVYADDVGFTRGQVEVNLVVNTTVNAPSAALERRLAALLASRARAQLG